MSSPIGEYKPPIYPEESRTSSPLEETREKVEIPKEIRDKINDSVWHRLSVTDANRLYKAVEEKGAELTRDEIIALIQDSKLTEDDINSLVNSLNKYAKSINSSNQNKPFGMQ